MFRKERNLTEPFLVLRRFSDEMDRLFNEVGFQRNLLPATEPVATWIPPVEMFEKDKQLCVRAELPGLTAKDVKVEVTENILTISGERKFEREEKKDEYFRTEREYGVFTREIALPEGVDFTKAKATFVDGVLELLMPLPAAIEPKKRTIAIEEVAPKTPVKTAA